VGLTLFRLGAVSHLSVAAASQTVGSKVADPLLTQLRSCKVSRNGFRSVFRNSNKSISEGEEEYEQRTVNRENR